MKKYKNYLIIILVLLILTLVVTCAIEIIFNIEKEAGMEVIMIGGSNMKENGNVNSCGYVIKNNKDKLIIVDGGRDIDAKIILDYINKLGHGKVDCWYITHPHDDHVGALVELLEHENIIIENLYYSFNSLQWYEKYDTRGIDAEKKMYNALKSSKIKNKISCTKNQIIKMDNIECEIIKIATPEIINSNNGNESSMVFKMTAKDVNKSMLFLGDCYIYASEILLKEPEKLKADVVQMAHHGQSGVTKQVYEAISPKLCCFNAPIWLYNNDSGNGYNTGKWRSIEVRSWVEELNAKSIVAFEGDKLIKFTKDKIEY